MYNLRIVIYLNLFDFASKTHVYGTLEVFTAECLCKGKGVCEKRVAHTLTDGFIGLT